MAQQQQRTTVNRREMWYWDESSNRLAYKGDPLRKSPAVRQCFSLYFPGAVGMVGRNLGTVGYKNPSNRSTQGKSICGKEEGAREEKKSSKVMELGALGVFRRKAEVAGAVAAKGSKYIASDAHAARIWTLDSAMSLAFEELKINLNQEKVPKFFKHVQSKANRVAPRGLESYLGFLEVL